MPRTQVPRPKASPPPIPASARKPAATTEGRDAPIRATVTVWIGDSAYQAILV